MEGRSPSGHSTSWIAPKQLLLKFILPFYRKAGARRPSSNDLKALNFAEIDKTLKYYRAEREIEDVYRSVDEVDALIAAAALSKLADEASLRIPAGADLDLREGWIFGV
jgi:hypothetical protein